MSEGDIPVFVDGVTPINAPTFNNFRDFLLGVRDQTYVARDEAIEAAEAAAAPGDDAVAAFVADPASATRAQLDDAYATSEALDDLASTSATTEDLFFSVMMLTSGQSIANSAAASFPVFIAPMPLRIRSVAMLSWGGTIAASDTAYWRVEIRKQTAAQVVTTIANKTTRVTAHSSDPNLPAGQAITTRAPWTFDTSAFTSPTLAAGEVFAMATYPTGSPTAIAAPLILTIGYEPL